MPQIGGSQDAEDDDEVADHWFSISQAGNPVKASRRQGVKASRGFEGKGHESGVRAGRQ
jgi:hypothetical protein